MFLVLFVKFVKMCLKNLSFLLILEAQVKFALDLKEGDEYLDTAQWAGYVTMNNHVPGPSAQLSDFVKLFLNNWAEKYINHGIKLKQISDLLLI